MLTLAISKGRMFELCLEILQKGGFTIKPSPIEQTRLLVFSFYHQEYKHRLLVVRNSDILSYINNSLADLAFLGSDIIMEKGHSNFYDYANVKTRVCRLMTARRKNALPIKKRHLRVATKYENIARNHYAAQGLQADIIKVRGSVELAVVIGFADQIVDIVDSGKTLADNNLEPVDKIADVSTRLIINKNAMKIKWREINHLINQLQL